MVANGMVPAAGKCGRRTGERRGEEGDKSMITLRGRERGDSRRKKDR
jgi:hypothetical protein